MFCEKDKKEEHILETSFGIPNIPFFQRWKTFKLTISRINMTCVQNIELWTATTCRVCC